MFTDNPVSLKRAVSCLKYPALAWTVGTVLRDAGQPMRTRDVRAKVRVTGKRARYVTAVVENLYSEGLLTRLNPDARTQDNYYTVKDPAALGVWLQAAGDRVSSLTKKLTVHTSPTAPTPASRPARVVALSTMPPLLVQLETLAQRLAQIERFLGITVPSRKVTP